MSIYIAFLFTGVVSMLFVSLLRFLEERKQSNKSPEE